MYADNEAHIPAVTCIVKILGHGNANQFMIPTRGFMLAS